MEEFSSLLGHRLRPGDHRYIRDDPADDFVDDLHLMEPDAEDDRLRLEPGLMELDFNAASKVEPSYGWSRIGTLMNPLMHALAGQARGSLHSSDAAVWELVRDMVPSRCPDMGIDPCGCYIVGCVVDAEGDLRISALIFGPPARRPGHSAEAVGHGSAAARTQHLRRAGWRPLLGEQAHGAGLAHRRRWRWGCASGSYRS